MMFLLRTSFRPLWGYVDCDLIVQVCLSGVDLFRPLWGYVDCDSKQNQLKKVLILCGFRVLKNAKSANHINIISH